MPKRISSKEISEASETLSGLIVQKKYSHMKEAVQIVLGGLLLPILSDRDEIDINDPNVTFFLSKYSRENIKKMLNFETVEVPVEITLETVIRKRLKYRRIRNEVKKLKRKKGPLTPLGRDMLIQWWNKNQRLIPSDDPICVVLTEQVNNIKGCPYPISNMQISGYFSLLCRMGLETEADRITFFTNTRMKGLHTFMPRYSNELIEVIKKNWLKTKKDKKQREKDHEKITKMRDEGNYKPIIAKD